MTLNRTLLIVVHSESCRELEREFLDAYLKQTRINYQFHLMLFSVMLYILTFLDCSCGLQAQQDVAHAAAREAAALTAAEDASREGALTLLKLEAAEVTPQSWLSPRAATAAHCPARCV